MTDSDSQVHEPLTIHYSEAQTDTTGFASLLFLVDQANRPLNRIAIFLPVIGAILGLLIYFQIVPIDVDYWKFPINASLTFFALALLTFIYEYWRYLRGFEMNEKMTLRRAPGSLLFDTHDVTIAVNDHRLLFPKTQLYAPMIIEDTVFILKDVYSLAFPIFLHRERFTDEDWQRIRLMLGIEDSETDGTPGT